MDELFSKLALYAVTTVGKAAFGMAVSKAVSNLSKSSIPSSSSTTNTSQVVVKSEQKQPMNSQKRFLELRSRLEQKIAILSPSIDMIQHISSKSNSPGLKAVLKMANELKDALVSLSQSNDIEFNPEHVCEKVETILAQMEDLVPYIQLALSISGVNLNTPSTMTMSLSVILNASSWIESKNLANLYFPCRFYTLFQSHVRQADQVSWTWKQDMLSCHVFLSHSWSSLTSPSSLESHAFLLNIKESFEDEGVHESEPLLQQYPVKDIQAYFFALAGQLLNIAEATQPVLVIKFHPSIFIALEIMEVEETDSNAKDNPEEEEEDEEEEKEDDLDQASKRTSPSSLDATTSPNSHPLVNERESKSIQLIPSTSPLSTTSSYIHSKTTKTRSYQLVLLDAILRLLVMETTLHQSHLTVSDETLMTYLSNDPPTPSTSLASIPYSNKAVPLHPVTTLKKT